MLDTTTPTPTAAITKRGQGKEAAAPRTRGGGDRRSGRKRVVWFSDRIGLACPPGPRSEPQAGGVHR